MKISKLITTVCLLAIAASGCAGTSEETGAAAQTTPAAAAGEPATPAEPAAAPAAPATAPAAAMPAPATAAPATPAASTAPAMPEMPKQFVLVTHKVKDYDAWKKVFDADAEARKSGGFVGYGIMRDVANDKLVTLYLPTTDLAKAKEFGSSKELKEKMKAGGVEGKPTMSFVNSIDEKFDPSKKDVSAALIKANVKDFAAFKTAFEGTATARIEAGLFGYGLGQDAEKKDVAYVYLTGDDAAKVKAYVESKETKKAWKDAGVKGTPTVSIVKEGEMSFDTK